MLKRKMLKKAIAKTSAMRKAKTGVTKSVKQLMVENTKLKRNYKLIKENIELEGKINTLVSEKNILKADGVKFKNYASSELTKLGFDVKGDKFSYKDSIVGSIDTSGSVYSVFLRFTDDIPEFANNQYSGKHNFHCFGDGGLSDASNQFDIYLGEIEEYVEGLWDETVTESEEEFITMDDEMRKLTEDLLAEYKEEVVSFDPNTEQDFIDDYNETIKDLEKELRDNRYSKGIGEESYLNKRERERREQEEFDKLADDYEARMTRKR